MRILAFASLPTLASASWPNVCDTTSTGWSQTRCADGHTCCSHKFSGSGFACCPLGDGAVCCASGLTCCPGGTTCSDALPEHWPSWATVTTCVPADGGAATPGVTSCKPGPEQAADATRLDVLVIGDSVSIGYTPFVASALSAEALVQHAPWGGDGGAEETAYGVQCLDYFLRAPSGEEYKADLIMFNWGLHDGPQLFDYPPANVTVPGQEGAMDVYAAELENITVRLKAHQEAGGGKLLFAVTSPMICKERADADVSWLNVQAKAVMEKHGVATVDLHAAVVGECGPAPQASCFGHDQCFCPHCDASGYQWLAESTIAPRMRELLGLSPGAAAVLA